VQSSTVTRHGHMSSRRCRRRYAVHPHTDCSPAARKSLLAGLYISLSVPTVARSRLPLDRPNGEAAFISCSEMLREDSVRACMCKWLPKPLIGSGAVRDACERPQAAGVCQRRRTRCDNPDL
jgi:hypothetical protein